MGLKATAGSWCSGFAESSGLSVHGCGSRFRRTAFHDRQRVATQTKNPARRRAMANATTPVRIRKLGHVVYSVSDLERSMKFWTEIMGFKFSDRNEHGMVFFRNASDHHTIAL